MESKTSSRESSEDWQNACAVNRRAMIRSFRGRCITSVVTLHEFESAAQHGRLHLKVTSESLQVTTGLPPGAGFCYNPISSQNRLEPDTAESRVWIFVPCAEYVRTRSEVRERFWHC